MKLTLKSLAVMILMFAISGISFSQDCHSTKTGTSSGDDDPVGTKVDGGVLYGKAIDVPSAPVAYSEFVAQTAEMNGKEVVLKGKISEVCQAMGCWMTMSDNGITTRVKTLHEFFLPKDVAGRDAIVTGKFVITEISEDQARHYNDEAKNPSIKSEDIVGPQKAYEIEASGIVILDAETK